MTLGRRLSFLLQFLKCDLDVCRWKREIELEALPARFCYADLWCYVFVFKSILCYSWSIVYQVACEKQKLMVQVASHSLDRKERGRCEFNAQPVQRKVFLYLLGFGAEWQAARLAVRQAMVWLANVCYQKKQLHLFLSSLYPSHLLHQKEPRRWSWEGLWKMGRVSRTSGAVEGAHGLPCVSWLPPQSASLSSL